MLARASSSLLSFVHAQVVAGRRHVGLVSIQPVGSYAVR